MGSVLASGVVAPSWNENLGHECWKPAVYTTPLMCTATRYARPHVLFSDGVYYRVVLELRVDDRRKIKQREAGGHQILFPADAVHVRAVWVRPNAPPCVAEERLSSWNPDAVLTLIHIFNTCILAVFLIIIRKEIALSANPPPP